MKSHFLLFVNKNCNLYKMAEGKKAVLKEEIASLPSFEDYTSEAIKGRPDEIAIRIHILWYGSMTNMMQIRSDLITLTKENNGTKKADTPEFKKVQQEWWYHYQQLTILRAFVLRFFGIRPPNWKELQPDRLYCGVLWSEEDFIKFIVQDGSGMALQKAESEESYAQELKEDRPKNRKLQEQLEKDSDDEVSNI